MHLLRIIVYVKPIHRKKEWIKANILGWCIKSLEETHVFSCKIMTGNWVKKTINKPPLNLSELFYISAVDHTKLVFDWCKCNVWVCKISPPDKFLKHHGYL